MARHGEQRPALRARPDPNEAVGTTLGRLGAAADAEDTAGVAATVVNWAEAAAAGCVDGAGAFVAATSVAVSSTPITAPWLTLSPSFRRSSVNTPACEDGTSMEALSDSMVMRLCSALMVAPG